MTQLPAASSQALEVLHHFLQVRPGTQCGSGGSAAFGNAVSFSSTPSDPVLPATAFMAYHTVLHAQSDFINGLRRAREISDELSDSVGASVFPYSVYYVFFEQYLTIHTDTALTLGLALAAIFVVATVLVGSLPLAVIIMLTVFLILADLGGVMYLWDISLNGVSLTNLVIGVGISVEFCAHIARAFYVAT